MRVAKSETLICYKRALVRFWGPESPEKSRALLLIVHGLGEHSGRYEKFARDLVESNNLEIHSFDLPGHGRTSGIRGYISRFEEYLEPIHEFVETLNSDKPKFIFGHSLGGLIATRYIQTHVRDFDGIILSSPALIFNVDRKISYIIPLLSFLNIITPWMRFPNGIDPETLSRNQEAIKKYIEDPLVHNKISIRLFCEMLRNSKLVQKKISNIRIPLLLVGGTDDKIVPFNKVVKLVEKVPLKSIQPFEGGYHELFEDEEHYHKLIETISNWIDFIIKLKEKKYA